MSHFPLPKNLNKDAALVRQGKPDYTKLEADAFPTPTVDEAGAILENSDTGNRYRWTGAVWVQTDRKGSQLVIATDFLTEMSKRNVPGHSLVAVSAEKPTVTATFEDLWDIAGSLTYPTGAESLEFVTTGNDIAAGTGAREVTLVYLDTSYVQQVAVQATPAVAGTQAITTTNFFRVISFAVTDGGGTIPDKKNENAITLQVASAGAVRATIRAEINKAQASHYTVAAGKVAVPLGFYLDTGKNTDAKARVLTTLSDAGIFYPALNISAFQSNVPVVLNAANAVDEKAEIKVVVKANGPSSDVSFLLQLLIIDKALTGL